MVSPVTLRNPGLLAKAVTTLDVISGGRAILGLGAALDIDDHAAHGIEFPGTGERFDRLDETLSICKALMQEEKATFAGDHYSITDAYNSPRPIRGSIPILIGGGGEKRTLDLVARYADACNFFGDAETVRHMFAVLQEHCERVGQQLLRDHANCVRPVLQRPCQIRVQPRGTCRSWSARCGHARHAGS